MNQPVQQIVVHVENKSNGFGLAGLILSILGWLTCGVLCIPGAFISFIGLFSKPRGTAIAGLIVGFPGVIFFVFVGMGILAGLLGLGAAASGGLEQAREAARRAQLDQVKVEPLVEEPKTEVEPEAVQPTPEPEPEPVVDPDKVENPLEVTRTFSDESDKFRVEAKVISVSAGQVSLKRADNGKIVTVPISKLSERDQRWLRVNFE